MNTKDMERFFTMYKYNIVIDLEMNPTFPKPDNGLMNEIIEIGAVKSDCNGNIIDTFNKCVKPIYCKSIAPRIYKLTGIRNQDIMFANSLNIVINELIMWIGDLSNIRFVSWSDTDLRQITVETQVKNIDCSFIHRWLDLQKIFSKMYNITKRRVRMRLKEAADYCNVEVLKSHRALDDAIVTNEIFVSILKGEYVTQRTYINQETNLSTIGDKFGSILSQFLCPAI